MTHRVELIHDWIQTGLGYRTYTLRSASEDASFRRYYRLDLGKQTKIIMDAPPEKEDCVPFLDVTKRLQTSGIHVPEIFASDIDLGLILLEDLGTTLYLDIISDANAEDLYRDAVQTLIRMQRDTSTEGLPRYDQALLLGEMHLFRDWLVATHLDICLPATLCDMLDDVFACLVVAATEQPFTFVHRDYHARNLMVNLKQNPGVLDYQDAVFGPFSYDLVSLFKDCYVKWPRQQVLDWVGKYYRAAVPQLNLNCSEKEFIRWFDLMGVQRHLKASGIFARLYCRDGKAGYLKDIPRTLSYILDLENVYKELDGLTTFIRQKLLPFLTEEK